MSIAAWCALQLHWIAHKLEAGHQAFERRRLTEEHDGVLRDRWLSRDVTA